MLGTRAFRDTLLFGREFRGEPLGPNDLFFATVTDDCHYLVVEIDRGVPARRVDIVYRDLTKPDSYFDVLIWGSTRASPPIYDQGRVVCEDRLQSAQRAAFSKPIPASCPTPGTTIVPEGADAIDDFSIVGDKIYVNRLHDVKTETSVYTLDGKPAGHIDYDGIGSASILAGRTTDRYGFFQLSSPSSSRPPSTAWIR